MKVFCLSAAALAALTGTALADDPTGAPATPDPAADPAMMAPAVPGTWPLEIISRPLTLKTGMIRVQGDLAISRLTIVADDGTSSSSTSASLLASAGYGVSDTIEVGGSYGLSLKEFEAKGPLTIYGLISVMDGQLKVAPGASVTYNLLAEKLGLGAGVAVQYNITPKLAVFTPATQLGIGLDPTTAALELPVGLMLQATPNINVQASTSIATIGIEPSGSSVIFSDRTPLLASLFYTPSNDMDFGISVSTGNVPDIADLFTIIVTGRLFVM